MKKNCFCCNNKLYRNINELYEIDIKRFKNIISNNNDVIILDVRSNQEYKEWHINNAINIPEYEIIKKSDKIINYKNNKIIIYCQNGTRSQKAYKSLKKLGFRNLYVLKDDIENIKNNYEL